MRCVTVCDNLQEYKVIAEVLKKYDIKWSEKIIGIVSQFKQ